MLDFQNCPVNRGMYELSSSSFENFINKSIFNQNVSKQMQWSSGKHAELPRSRPGFNSR